jgi:hypothetical protein
MRAIPKPADTAPDIRHAIVSNVISNQPLEHAPLGAPPLQLFTSFSSEQAP